MELLAPLDIVDEYGLTYNPYGQRFFTLQLVDQIILSAAEQVAIQSVKETTQKVNNYLQTLFSVVYLISASSSFVLVYDMIILFTLLRYLNIDYPENLSEFFKATDSFKLSLQFISRSRPPQTEDYQQIQKVTFIG